MKKLLIIPLVFLLCFTFGCQQGEEVAEEPAVVDVSADIEAIKNLCRKWEEGYNARDVDQIISVLANNFVGLYQGDPLVIGKDAYRNSLENEFAQFITEAVGPVEDVQVSGDLAYARGTWTAIRSLEAGGESEKATYRWVSAYQKQLDGTWKCICDISNSEQPLTPLFISQE